MTLELLFSHPWAAWIILAAISGIVEMLVPSFSFVFVSVAALAAALTSLGWDWPAQIVAFSAVLVASVFLLRPRMLERFHNAKKIPSRAQVLLGKTGQVTEAIDPTTRSGRVTVDGQDWAASSQSPIAAGRKVTVESSDGIVLIVAEDGLGPSTRVKES